MTWRTRETFEQEERSALAPWAACAADSAGRFVPEPLHDYRTAFQRDRDRIIHARAFRRLEFKTQVFVHLEHVALDADVVPVLVPLLDVEYLPDGAGDQAHVGLVLAVPVHRVRLARPGLA